MHTNPQIVILIEHISREFSIACVLKMFLEQKYGFTVHIQSIWDTSNLNRVKPKLLLTPFFRTLNSVISPFVYKWNEAKIINLCYEQVFRSHQLKFREPKGDFVKEKVMHICWGDQFKDFLYENGVIKENLIVNGNLQYQLYKEPYNSVYDSKEILSQKYNISSKKKWLLFPENYGALFGGDKSVTNPVSSDLDLSVKVKDFVQKSFQETMKWIDEFSKDNDFEIIIRPRPMTPKDELVKAYKEINGNISENIHFVKEDKARDWILSSDYIVSNYSTTLIEASLANKKTYMLEPYEFPEYMVNEWYKYIPKINNYKDLNSIDKENSLQPNTLKSWAISNISPDFDVIEKIISYLALELKNYKPVSNSVDNYYLKDDVKIPKPIGYKYHSKKIASKILQLTRLNRIYKKGYHIHHEITESDRISDEKISNEISRWKILLEQI